MVKKLLLVMLVLVFIITYTPVISAQSKTGGTLIYGKPKDAVKIDPHNITDGESADITVNIFETLVNFKDEKTEVEPGLATSWSTSKDGLSWTFKLRKDVKFHDGTPFNAEAVVVNFERQMFENNPYHKGPFEYWASMFGGFPGIVKKVSAVDELTVRFDLEKPSAPFLTNLAMFSFAIMSPASLKKYGEDVFKNPVGTGPFKFVEWIPNERIVVEANKEYRGGRPYLDKIVFKPILENSVRLLELEKGSVHAMHFVPPDDAARIKKNTQLRLVTQTGMNVGYMAFMTEKEPFTNKKVRQALSHAIDKKAVIKALFGEYGVPAKTYIPPVLWGYNDAIKDYDYNVAKAKKILAETGYPNGFKTTLWAMPVARPYMPDARKCAEALQQYFKAVNVDAQIVSFEWGTYLDKSKKGEHDMLILGWTGDNGDPDNFLYTLLSSDAAVKGRANNRAFYKNPKLDEILKKAQAISDQKERAKLYRDAQVILHEDAPWIPLVHSVQMAATRANVKGYKLHPTGNHRFYKVSLE